MQYLMKSLCFIIFLSVTTVTHSQPPASDSVGRSIDSLSQLSFMQGTWRGAGWVIIDREKHTFTQRETITPKVNKTILVIEGLGLSKDTTGHVQEVVHEAFGVIWYDKSKHEAMMTSFATTGGKTETALRLTGDRQLQWQFEDANGGIVRFTEDFTSEGVWHEVGEYQYAPGQWFTFFEMTLYRL